MPLVEQKQTAYPSGTPELIPHSFLVGFMLLDLKFYVQCFVDRCLSFFFWPLRCLSFNLQILNTPLVSSNASPSDLHLTFVMFIFSHQIKQVYVVSFCSESYLLRFFYNRICFAIVYHRFVRKHTFNVFLDTHSLIVFMGL